MRAPFHAVLSLVLLSAAAVWAQDAPYAGGQEGPYEGSGAYGDPAYSGNPNGGDPAQQAGDATPPDVAGPGVARVSFMGGDVSVRRGDSNDPVAAALNAPMMAGDILATGASARAELQFDSANRLRVGNDAEVRIAEMQAGHFRVELARGTVSLSVSREGGQAGEVSTPLVSVRLAQRGRVRVAVSDDGQTFITAQSGDVEVYSQRGTERVPAGQMMVVRGSVDDPEFQVVAATQPDEWDSWNEQRDQALTHVSSYQYVNPDVTGVEDLDAYGSWNNDPAYGQVWVPRVDPNWSPYGDGRWIWEDYYGWTWLSNDPWGWAPYHYGNWYRGSLGWCWYPGALYHHAFWRPALVAFFGFGNFGVGVGFGGWGHVGWLPLAPYERFHPWYGHGFGAGYLARNYHVTNVNITNLYRNARVNGAMHGVDAGSFASGRFNSIGRVSAEQVRTAGLVRGGLPIAPTDRSLRFNDRSTGLSPQALNNSHFMSRTPGATGAYNRTPFTQQRQGIEQSTARYMQSGARMGAPGTSRLGLMQPGQQSARANAGDNSAWGRFGTPGQAVRNVAPPRQASAAATGPVSPNTSGWNRFGSPATSGRAPGSGSYGPTGAYSRTGNAYSSGARSSYGGNPQSLRLSPSMVHNRSGDGASGVYSNSGAGYRQPSYSAAPRTFSGSGYESRGGYNAPPRTYSAPTYSSRPSMSPGYGSAPQRSYSAPSMNRPSYSRPSYSAPRSSGYSGGGGRSSAPSGGSHSGGGSSHSSGSGSGGGGHHR